MFFLGRADHIKGGGSTWQNGFPAWVTTSCRRDLE